jgi:hypothetical protein
MMPMISAAFTPWSTYASNGARLIAAAVEADPDEAGEA